MLTMPPKRVSLEVKSRPDRVKLRKELGDLRDLVVTKKTLSRYEHACTQFFAWMKQSKLCLPCDMFRFDELCSDFICSLWDEGEARSLGCNFLSGLQHKVPALKRHLNASWRLIGAWGRHEMPARAPPLTLELMEALCGEACKISRGDAAVVIYLAFDCILRTSELLSVRKQDVAIEPCGSSAVINLGLTKTGLRHGAAESVTTDNPVLCKLLSAKLLYMKPGDFLFTGSQAEFRSLFKQLCTALKLDEWQFRPYSLRRGGATHVYKCTGNLSKTIIRGRWGSAKAARVYINEGLATLAQFRYNTPEIAESAQIFRTIVSGKRPGGA